MPNKMWVVPLVLFCGLLGAVAQVLFKSASRNLTFSIAGVLTNWQLLLGMGLYLVAMILFWIALKQGNVSSLYPLIATSYIWTALLANRFLREKIDPATIIGIAFVVIGVGILSYRVTR